MRRAAGALALVALTTAAEAQVTLVPVFRGLHEPVYLTALPNDDRVFVVEQAGRVAVLQEGRPGVRVFLDITDRVGSGGERGLLSMAFHPRFRHNGRVFVDYTDRRGDTHVAEFRADTAGIAADPASERELLLVRQPYANHNGGHILFGPDGGLYVGMGDGGAAGDPGGRAQDPREVLGKLLRLSVDDTSRGVGNEGTVRTSVPLEIFALGLRNPWRFWFDSGLVYIADVGQNRWEEVDVAPLRSGLNFGWRTTEGAHCFINPLCSKSGQTLPVLEYSHREGCSIIGGMVYRGSRMPSLRMRYFYSDYCEGWLKSFLYRDGRATEQRTWPVQSPGAVYSFGVDGHGELYLLAASGTIYRLETPAH